MTNYFRDPTPLNPQEVKEKREQAERNLKEYRIEELTSRINKYLIEGDYTEGVHVSDFSVAIVDEVKSSFASLGYTFAYSFASNTDEKGKIDVLFIYPPVEGSGYLTSVTPTQPQGLGEQLQGITKLLEALPGELRKVLSEVVTQGLE